MCVRERERERERESQWSHLKSRFVCVCVCVCVRERERGSQWSHLKSRFVCERERESKQRCLSRDCYPLGLELMVKLRTLLSLILKAEAGHYGKGRYISDTMHCASWPIRADGACRKEGLCRKLSV